MILPSPFGCTSAKQSPPIPVDCGSITPSSAHAATAASAAVPPACRTRSRSAPPADATSPPSRSGRGPSTGRRDGNSSCQIAHFFDVISASRPSGAGLLGIIRAAHGQCPGWMAAMRPRRKSSPLEMYGVRRGFPSPARLINPRHALQRRRFLPICRAAGFPGAARAAARDLRRSRAERQRAAGHEGINGTLAGSEDAIDALVARVARRPAVRRPARPSRTEILAAPRRCRFSG